LQFSAEGFLTGKFNVKEENLLNVNLLFKDTDKAFKLATANHISKEKLKDAVDNYAFANNNYKDYRDIYDLIQAEIPGITLDDTSSPVRVISSRATADRNGELPEVLYVVNDIVSFTIDDVFPAQVKSIKLLKGNDTAVYGSRGENGVLVIQLTR